MKNLLAWAVMIAAIALSSCKYDDDDLWSSVHGLEDRVAKLEELCKQMNTNIVSLQAIVNVLQESDYITGVAPVMQNGKEVGYIITFSKSNPYHDLSRQGWRGWRGRRGRNGWQRWDYPLYRCKTGYGRHLLLDTQRRMADR